MRKWWHWAQSLIGKAGQTHEADIDEEIRAHLSMEAAQRMDRGESPEAARNQARKDFGNVTRTKEDLRRAARGASLSSLIGDIRYGIRRAWKRPAVTAAVVLTLAAGTGALTAIYSVVEASLLAPLPYRASDELHQLWRVDIAPDGSRGNASPGASPASRRLPTSALFREVSTAGASAGAGIDHVAAYSAWMTTVVSGGDPERVFAACVSDGFFETLGVPMHRGRSFASVASAEDPEHRVILTHHYWHARFGGRNDLLGESIVLDGVPFTVTGILPPSFRPYLWGVNEDCALFVPLAREDGTVLRRRSSHVVLLRLPEQVDPREAKQRLTMLAQRHAASVGEKPEEYGIALNPLQEELVAGIRPMLLTLLGVAAAIFVIACVNLANLTLAQTAARARELGVRGALGASRLRVARQILVECLVPAIPGGILGCLLAYTCAQLFAALYPGGLPRVETVPFHPGIAAMALLLSVLGALFFGVLPAWQFSGSWVRQAVRQSPAAISASAGGRSPVLSVLVFAEVALIIVVLSCAALLVRSFVELRNLPLGYDRSQVLTAQVALPESRYPTEASQAAFAEELVRRFESVPGVEAAAVTNTIPLAFNSLQTADFSLPAKPELPPQRLGVRTVSSHFFQTLGVPLLAGEGFSGIHTAEADTVVVNEAFVRRYFPGEQAVGETLRYGERNLRIIGVAGDLRNMRLQREPAPEVYRPFASMPWPLVDVAVRAGVPPLELVPQLRAELSRIDPEVALARTTTMAANVDEQLAKPRFHAAFTALLTAIALFLGVVGIYGVAAYLTRLRIPEFGIRLALGATPRSLLALVVREGMRAPLVAAVVALPVSYLAARSIESLLFGVKAEDVSTYALVGLIALGISAMAVLIPAGYASRTSPMEALRHE